MEPATDVEQSPGENRANSAESAPLGDVQELQQGIEQAREQLGDTVEQLVAKADVKARAQDRAAELAGRVKGQAGFVQVWLLTSRAGVWAPAMRVTGVCTLTSNGFRKGWFAAWARFF